MNHMAHTFPWFFYSDDLIECETGGFHLREPRHHAQRQEEFPLFEDAEFIAHIDSMNGATLGALYQFVAFEEYDDEEYTSSATG